MSEQRKKKGSVGRLWDNFKQPNIYIIGVSQGDEKEHEIGNLFEKIMQENFQISEGNRHVSPGSTESPKQDGCKEAHPKTYQN